VELQSDGAVDIKGGITVASGATMTFTPASADTFTFSGATPQAITINGTFTEGANATLEVKNATGLVLATDWTLGGGGIKFTHGNVATGANTLILPGATPIANASQATGWVAGRLRRNVPTGGAPRAFDVGDGSVYAPATLTFNGLAAGFDLTALAPSVDHPNLATSGLDVARSLNRYWTLTPSSAPSFTSFDAVFAFGASDVDGGADPLAFAARRWDGSTWSALTTGTRTATSTQVTSVTALGDFALADLPSLTLTATAGPGGSIAPSAASDRIGWQPVVHDDAGCRLRRCGRRRRRRLDRRRHVVHVHERHDQPHHRGDVREQHGRGRRRPRRVRAVGCVPEPVGGRRDGGVLAGARLRRRRQRARRAGPRRARARERRARAPASTASCGTVTATGFA
jgi:hypothetical protein